MTVVFLALLRNALGVQRIPPNMAMYGLAIILSLYVMMAPVGFATRDYLRNHDVSLSDSASVERFLDEGMAPYRNFLKRQIQGARTHLLHGKLPARSGPANTPSGSTRTAC